jgi:hypothetical protein
MGVNFYNRMQSEAATLTNVILDNLTINNNTAYDAEYDNGNSGTTKTITWTNGNRQKVVLTGNCTFTFAAPLGVGTLSLKLIQEAVGAGHTATWPATVLWPSDTAPTLSTAVNAVDIVTLYYDGSYYNGQAALNFA